MDIQSILGQNTRLLLIAMVLGGAHPLAAQNNPTRILDIDLSNINTLNEYSSESIQNIFSQLIKNPHVSTNRQEINQALQGCKNTIEQHVLIQTIDQFNHSYKKAQELGKKIKRLHADIQGHTFSYQDKTTLTEELHKIQLSVLIEKSEIPRNLNSLSETKERFSCFFSGQELSADRLAYFQLHKKIFKAREVIANSLQTDLKKVHTYIQTPLFHQKGNELERQ